MSIYILFDIREINRLIVDCQTQCHFSNDLLKLQTILDICKKIFPYFDSSKFQVEFYTILKLNLYD